MALRFNILTLCIYHIPQKLASLIAGGVSIGFSGISLLVMSMCPKLLIQISLLFSLVCSFLIIIVSFFYGNIVGGIFGIIFFLLSVCYACMVWKRIPFAAANLNTGLTAVKKNAGVVFVAYTIVFMSFLYSMLWMTALVGIYDKEGICNTTETITDGSGNSQVQCEGSLFWGYFFLILLAFFW